jgi:hypothetical protein
VATEKTIDDVVKALHKVQNAAEELRESGLTRRAVVLLLHDMSKVPKREIHRVLEAIPEMAEFFLYPPDEDER